MKKIIFLAVTCFYCSTTVALAQDNSALYIDGINNGVTPDNKPLVNSKLVHADPSGDMVLIDGLTIPNNVQKTTTEMSKALKKSLAMSSDCIPRCD